MTWRSTVTAGKAGQPQPVSCRSTSSCTQRFQRPRSAKLRVLSEILSQSFRVSGRWTDTIRTSLARSIHRRSRSVRNFRTHWFEKERRLAETKSSGNRVPRPVGCGEKNRERVGNKQRIRRGASGKPVNVVPVLRPVTDCRLSDRLRPDQTQGNGSREDRAGLRPPGKKGAEPAGRDSGRSCCRP